MHTISMVYHINVHPQAIRIKTNPLGIMSPCIYHLCIYVATYLYINVAMGLYHFIGSAVYITTYLWMCSAFITIVAQKNKMSVYSFTCLVILTCICM